MASPISSLQNARVKNAVKLRDRRQRDKQGRIIIDGLREITRAAEANVQFVEIFVCRELCRGAESQALIDAIERTGAEVLAVTPQVFERIAFGQRLEGIVALARPPQRTLQDIELGQNPLVAVLEGIEKPGNVGAVLRSADAAGISAVLLADAATDLYNPNTIRASLGAVFSMPVCAAAGGDVLAWLRDQKLPIYAARVDGAALYTQVSYAHGAVLVLGSEASGLSDLWRSDDIQPIVLPMYGAVDSLNVSAAAAVLFFEARRQQGAGG